MVLVDTSVWISHLLEALAFMDARRLMGKGLGLVDVHLLASALVSGIALWTLDRRLNEAAVELQCAYAGVN